MNAAQIDIPLPASRRRHPVVDGRRLARVAHLAVEQLDADTYRVSGGAGVHLVTREGSSWSCDCVDAAFHRSGVCSHRLARALFELPSPVRSALRDLVPTPRRIRYRKAATT